ncbi:MAG: glycoside hydrolase domain-containing protein [Draconibacterium sp.]
MNSMWDSVDIGYGPTHRAWGAEAFHGSLLPNAMVQLTPVTQFHSGSGYQYKDTVIYGFAHTSKGHWNLCHIPFLQVTGNIEPNDYKPAYSHKNESAQLSKIKVTGGTEKQRGLFYSAFYRSFLWPTLRSDINGGFTDQSGTVVSKGFNY